MMRASKSADAQATIFPADKRNGKMCAAVSMYSRAALIILFLTLLVMTEKSSAQTVALQVASAPGGITLTPSGGSRWVGQFGTMNALGIGTPGTGVSVISLTNGALYFTHYQITVSSLPGGHTANVTGFVNSNFTHPAALILESCPSTSTCNASGNYSAMSLNGGAPTALVPAGGNQTVTAGLAVFLPDNNGATAFAGLDTVRITLTATDQNNGKTSTVEIRLDTPQGETLQSAIRLTLASATGGLTVSSAADYAMNFGSVNGLGINPAAGLTVNSATGGAIYSTPYLLQPAFTDQTYTTTTIKVPLSTNFAHPAVLSPDDAAASIGPFTQIPATPITITNKAAIRTSI